MKINKIIIIILIFISILIIKDVSAIGITPGRTTINFEPNLEREVKFTIINSEHKDMKVLLSVDGELASYVTLSNILIDFSSNEESKDFKYTINLPSNLENPGVNEVNIIATELPPDADEEGAFVGATAAVATQLHINVPYPGKYLTIDLQVEEAQPNEPVIFHVPVMNFGEEDILHAQASIDILGANNEKIVTIESEDQSINAKEKDEFVMGWDADVNSGAYHAIVIVRYDGKIARIEKNFNVGNLMIDVNSITVNNFNLGGIAKFNILVESKWNEKIGDVYGQMLIDDEDGKNIADFKTASVDVDAFAKQEMIAYWDTEGIKEGTYNGKIILHYMGRTTERALETKIGLNSIETSILGTGRVIKAAQGEGIKTNNLLIGLVIVLVIVNVGWFIYLRKKKN
ncbi:MAG: hypothetical protein KJ674_03290 [Nanoarchaeota archaeon]|nr:hypothetical protein [Nanoarchaeota archaeon]